MCRSRYGTILYGENMYHWRRTHLWSNKRMALASRVVAVMFFMIRRMLLRLSYMTGMLGTETQNNWVSYFDIINRHFLQDWGKQGDISITKASMGIGRYRSQHSKSLSHSSARTVSLLVLATHRLQESAEIMLGIRRSRTSQSDI